MNDTVAKIQSRVWTYSLDLPVGPCTGISDHSHAYTDSHQGRTEGVANCWSQSLSTYKRD